MTSLAFSLERRVAISAVARACSLTSIVFQNLVKNETLTKGDKSPVTGMFDTRVLIFVKLLLIFVVDPSGGWWRKVADFSAQAVVNAILTNAFPDDPIVGEEDSADLRSPATEGLRKHLTTLANDALHLPLRSGSQYGDAEEDAGWGIGPDSPVRSTEELLNLIDRGTHEGGPTGRMWTLDPIDGTKGFLRGGQYAIGLALIVDSKVQFGIMGCPNIPVSPTNPDGERGCIFVATRGHGAQQLSLSNLGLAKAIRHPQALPPISSIALLESYEAMHSSHSFSTLFSKYLDITAPPLRMDSQAKYSCLARGEGGIYFRTPVKGLGYREKIWDHAAGVLLVEEAGGVATDQRGELLNFGLGRTLGENHGIVACFKDLHPRVLEAIKKATEEEEKIEEKEKSSL